MHGCRVAEVYIFILWGKVCCFGEGLDRLVPALLMVRSAAAPSCPGCVQSWSLWTLAVSTFC